MHPARRLWMCVEPIHAIVYFVPEARTEYAAAGLKGGWMGYFASRSAPLGAVSAGAVVATFHNFAPGLVHRAIPSAWTLSTPERALAARSATVMAAISRLAGDVLDASTMDRAATRLRDAVDTCDAGGRPLFAGHSGLPWPEEPMLALWHAATLLREHRFDGHVATLVSEGVDGIQALILASLAGGIDRATTLVFRGWSDEEWDAAAHRLAGRGLVTEDGNGLSDTGRALRAHVEERTDHLAAAPTERLGPEGLDAVIDLIKPLAGRLIETSGIPFPNPIGLPRPAA